MKIALIAPVLPPQLNGVGDYTALLARELAKTHPVAIWTGQSTPFDPVPGAAIEPLFRVGQTRSFRALEAAAQREKPDWIVLQHSGFGYGPRGWNPELPRVLRRIARGGETRLALMIHEPFVFADSPKTALMSWWQKAQLWSLGHTASAVFTSIEAWPTELHRYFPRRLCRHLPVFSNLPHQPVQREQARRELGLDADDFVLGVFGTAHEARLLGRIGDGARAVEAAGRRAVVLYVGPHGNRIRAAVSGVPVLDQGALAAPEVSARFAAMDLYLAAFSDGISTRRGSLMAALQHGVPVLATAGHLTDSVWHAQNGKSLVLAPVESGEIFAAKVAELVRDGEARRAIGRAGQALYEREFSVEVTARRMMESLDSL